MNVDFSCRMGCGACCIAPSISTPLPKMPQGKPAGVACAHLSDQYLCELFNLPERPAVCAGLQASLEMCGTQREHALHYLHWLEKESAPAT